ncbi:hypothetical protein D9V86_09895 [Bacteroidetes/Chlorobi group bacterium ChocPot_Mid]|nr:MAG: hypothetical protein D9V86_09895 [Bacteroidetes/Chlorobi group bacterium ChocPot_Mid]
MSKGKYISNVSEIIQIDEELEVPIYSTSFTAGQGVNVMDGIEKETIPKLKDIKPNGTYLIRISGDSMEPKLTLGDIVIVDTTITNFKSGDVVAVCLNGDYIVKIYDPGSLCLYLSSFNQDYEPIRVYEEDECIILGKATKYIRDI